MKIIRVESCRACPWLGTRHYGTEWKCLKALRIIDEGMSIKEIAPWCPLEDAK